MNQDEKGGAAEMVKSAKLIVFNSFDGYAFTFLFFNEKIKHAQNLSQLAETMNGP